MQLKQPHYQPPQNLLNHLVYTATGGDVALTMVDGKVLYEAGEFPTLDLEKISAETKRSYDRITQQLLTHG